MGPGLHTLNDKTVVITGASGGIGRAAAIEIARHGAHVALLDKSDIRTTMVQMPALNTTQFSWLLSRLPHQAQPVPPVYQPEPANLWQPADGEVDRGFHGIFDDRSKRRSPQRWASEHHWALVTAGTAAAATVAAAIGRRAVKGVR